jgi:BASS family bile acid:Na+ symporter
LLVKRLVPGFDRLLPLLTVVTNASLVTLVVLTLVLNLPTVLGVVGTGIITASLLFITGAFGIGWAFGGMFGAHLRDEMALGTAQRKFAAALVVATQTFEARGVLVMAVVVSIVTMTVLFPATKLLRLRTQRQSAAA